MKTKVLVLFSPCVALLAGCAEAPDLSEADWDRLAEHRFVDLEQTDLFKDDEVSGLRVPRNIGSRHEGDYNEVWNDPVAITLGRELYFDIALSRNGQVACNTCHDAAKSGIDPARQPGSTGSSGVESVRNAPTLYNSGYRQHYGWFGETSVMWRQILVPLRGAFHQLDERSIGAHVCADHRDSYDAVEGWAACDAAAVRPRFRIDDECDALDEEELASPEHRDCHLPRPSLTPGSLVTMNAAKAIAAFSRTLESRDGEFDRFMGEGFDVRDEAAMSPEAVRGAKLFVGRAACNECHNGPMFSDGRSYILGVGTGEQERDPFGELRRYQTPALRQVAQTGPYMHDGTLSNLWEVLEFYRAGGDSRFGGDRPPELAPLALSDQDMLDIEAFLGALDGAPLDHCWTTKDPICCAQDGQWLPDPLPESCADLPRSTVPARGDAG